MTFDLAEGKHAVRKRVLLLAGCVAAVLAAVCVGPASARDTPDVRVVKLLRAK
jgi:hypothetical protein